MKNKSKNKQNKTNKRIKSEVRISKGVYVYPSGTYGVRTMINGTQTRLTFSNKREALSFYRSVNS